MRRDYTEALERYLEEERHVLDTLSLPEVNEVIGVLERARMEGKRVFVCGNGGSGATASHMVCDFNKGVSLAQETKHDFECLNDNLPSLMAVANDIGYEEVFVLPLRNKLRAGDVVIGISGSGNSENVVRALSYAKEHGAQTVAITGYDGGRMKKLAQYNVHVASNNMQIVEDLHLVLNHMMMYVLAQENLG